jgi:hypothetical protein
MTPAERDDAARVVAATDGIVTSDRRNADAAKLDAFVRALGLEVEAAGAFYLLAEAGHAGRRPPPIIAAEVEP